MRVHCLIFLTSSALSAHADGGLEPAAFNGTAPYSPAAARSRIDHDNDDLSTRPLRKNDLQDADERALLGNALSSVQGMVENAMESVSRRRRFDRLRKSIHEDERFVPSIQAALEKSEWRDLYESYQGSGRSLVEVLNRQYGANRMARALSSGLKADEVNPALFAEPMTTHEKLAMDQLNLWNKKDKTLKDVFGDLKLKNKDKDEDLSTYLASRRMKVLAAYSKIKYPEDSDKAFVKALTDGVGGVKNFRLLLADARQFSSNSVLVDWLDKVVLRTCLAEKMYPEAAFMKVGLDLFPPNMFDPRNLRKMEQYVEVYNNKRFVGPWTTVLDAVKKMLGGESALLKVLTTEHVNAETKINMLLYEKQLFKRWISKEINPKEGLVKRIQGLERAPRKAIESRFKSYYRKHPPQQKKEA